MLLNIFHTCYGYKTRKFHLNTTQIQVFCNQNRIHLELMFSMVTCTISLGIIRIQRYEWQKTNKHMLWTKCIWRQEKLCWIVRSVKKRDRQIFEGLFWRVGDTEVNMGMGFWYLIRNLEYKMSPKTLSAFTL